MGCPWQDRRRGQRQRRVSGNSSPPAVTKKFRRRAIRLSNAMNVGHPSNLARLISFTADRWTRPARSTRMPDPERCAGIFFRFPSPDERTVAGIRDFGISSNCCSNRTARRVAGLARLTAQEPLGNTPAVIVETEPGKVPGRGVKVVGWEAGRAREHAGVAKIARGLRPPGHGLRPVPRLFAHPVRLKSFTISEQLSTQFPAQHQPATTRCSARFGRPSGNDTARMLTLFPEISA